MAVVIRLVLALVLAASGRGADFSPSTTARVQISNNATHALSTYTISAWAREPGYSSFDTMIVRQSSSTTFQDRTFFLSLKSSPAGHFTVQGRESGNDIYSLDGGSTVDDDVWRHFCVTLADQDAAYLYINGAEADSDTGLTASVWTGSGVIDIGYITTQSGFPWAGDIEDIRLYNRALSAAEVETIYALRGCDGITYGLVGRWPMMEGAPGVAMSGTDTVIDYSPTGEHGTPQGSTKPDYAESPLRLCR